MAETTNAQLHAMLRSYERQLLAARRLARFRVQRRLAEGSDPQDPDPSLKRRASVEKVAQELFDTLIFTGSDNPVVEEIRRELGRTVGQDVQFVYPPGGKLCIVGKGPQGPRILSEEEQRRTRYILWRITRQKVDQSMLDEPAKD